MRFRKAFFVFFLVPSLVLAQGALDYYAHGNTLLSQGKAAEAAAYYQYAVQVDPKLWQAWQGLGSAQEASGQRSEALVAYRKSLELNPGNAALSDYLRTLKGSAAAAPVATGRRKIKIGLARVSERVSAVSGTGSRAEERIYNELTARARFEVSRPADLEALAEGKGLKIKKDFATGKWQEEIFPELAAAAGLDYIMNCWIVRSVVEAGPPTVKIGAGPSPSMLNGWAAVKGGLWSKKTAAEAVELFGQANASKTGPPGAGGLGGNANVMHSEIAYRALDWACEILAAQVYEAFPLLGKVVRIEDPEERLVRLDFGAGSGLRKGDELSLIGSGAEVAELKVEETTAEGCLAGYKKKAAPEIQPGMEVRLKKAKR